MPRDKSAAHGRIVEAARREFLARGYQGASLRRIAEEAGLTAAGLYRHFDGKEAMFLALTEPAVRRAEAWRRERAAGRKSAPLRGGEPWRDDLPDLMREVVYPNGEDYRLLLSRPAGGPGEDWLDRLAAELQRETERLLPMLRDQGYPARPVGGTALRLLFRAYLTALLEPVVRGYPEKEALDCLETAAAFFRPGWRRLLGLDRGAGGRGAREW